MREIQSENTGDVTRLAVLWIALNLLDAAISYLALRQGMHELNPLFSQVAASLSLFLLTKLVLALVALAILMSIDKLRLLKWLNMGIGAFVIWNTIQMLI